MDLYFFPIKLLIILCTQSRSVSFLSTCCRTELQIIFFHFIFIINSKSLSGFFTCRFKDVHLNDPDFYLDNVSLQQMLCP